MTAGEGGWGGRYRGGSAKRTFMLPIRSTLSWCSG